MTNCFIIFKTLLSRNCFSLFRFCAFIVTTILWFIWAHIPYLILYLFVHPTSSHFNILPIIPESLLSVILFTPKNLSDQISHQEMASISSESSLYIFSFLSFLLYQSYFALKCNAGRLIGFGCYSYKNKNNNE